MRPIPTFILLTFAISYVAAPLTMWVANAWLAGLPEIARSFVAVSGAVAGPFIAALVVVSRTEGADGRRRLLATLRPRAADIVWVLLLPIVTLAVALTACAVSGTPVAVTLKALPTEWPPLALRYAIGTVVVGFGEELGWRGWLLPTLLERRSRLHATLLVAAVWYVWHLPKLLSGPEIAIGFAAGCFGSSLLFTALWSLAGRRVFPVAAAHAAFNLPWFHLEKVVALKPMLAAWVANGALYLLLGALLVTATWRWWSERTSERAKGVPKDPLMSVSSERNG